MTIIYVTITVLALAVFFGVVAPAVRRKIDALPINAMRDDDPMRLCRMYVEKGCPHIYRELCNIRKCTLLKNYNRDNEKT